MTWRLESEQQTPPQVNRVSAEGRVLMAEAGQLWVLEPGRDRPRQLTESGYVTWTGRGEQTLVLTSPDEAGGKDLLVVE